MFVCIVLSLLIVTNVISQQQICVPIGTCPTRPTNPEDVDPRVVTPTQMPIPVCPPGQEPCNVTSGSRPTESTVTSPTRPSSTQPSQTRPTVPSATTQPSCGRRTVNTPTNLPGNSVFGAFPWQAFLTSGQINNRISNYLGSGALISSTAVITAAHKIQSFVQTPRSVNVIMGVWDPMNITATQTRTGVTIKLHESFNSSTLKNDIAIIKVDAPFTLGTFPNIGCVLLPEPTESFVGQSCTVSGWGDTSFMANDAPTRPQKQVTIPIVDTEECRDSLFNVLPTVDQYLDKNGELCAGGEAQKDACTNDGGSPLVCSENDLFTVAGLVIWGKGCGRAGIPGVYVNVAYYRDWIDTNAAS